MPKYFRDQTVSFRELNGQVLIGTVLAVFSITIQGLTSVEYTIKANGISYKIIEENILGTVDLTPTVSVQISNCTCGASSVKAPGHASYCDIDKAVVLDNEYPDEYLWSCI
jgi:hypothetical protein